MLMLIHSNDNDKYDNGKGSSILFGLFHEQTKGLFPKVLPLQRPQSKKIKRRPLPQGLQILQECTDASKGTPCIDFGSVQDALS